MIQWCLEPQDDLFCSTKCAESLCIICLCRQAGILDPTFAPCPDCKSINMKCFCSQNDVQNTYLQSELSVLTLASHNVHIPVRNPYECKLFAE